MTRRAALLASLGCLTVAALGVLFFNRVYAGPAALLDSRIGTLRASIETMEDDLNRHPQVRARLREASGTMLPGREDGVEHLLRTELRRLCESVGMAVLAVDNLEGKSVVSPIVRSHARTDALKKALSRQADFLTMTGTVQARGTLAQAMSAMALARAQAWVHHLVFFSLRPSGEQGDQFELRFQIITAFDPGLTASRTEPPARVELAAVDASSWASIVDHNVFRAPPAPTPVAGPAPQADPTPPPVRPADPPPYKDWRVTSILSVGTLDGAGSATEVLLLNVRDQRRRTLRPGEKVLGAVLIEAGGEFAVFEGDGARFRVRLGSTLDRREPESQVDVR